MPAPVFFFFAPTAFQFEQITQVTVDICTKGGAAEVFINSKLRIYPLIWLQLVEKSGLCISESCLVGESTFEGGVTVFIAVTNTTFELFFLSFFLISIFLNFAVWAFCCFLLIFSTPIRYEKTLPKNTKRSQTQISAQTPGRARKEQIWAGEMWCAQGGWESLLLKKSWDVT